MTTEALPEVNTELFAKIRDTIAATPASHNQSLWEAYDPICGTVRCAAGWAIWHNDPNPETNLDDKIDALGASHASEAGRDLLGLTYDESDWLFYQSNRKAQAMIEHYAEHGREGWEFP